MQDGREFESLLSFQYPNLIIVDEIRRSANTGDGSFCLRRDEDVRYIVEDLNPVVSAWLTIRNMVGGFVKKAKFVERV